MKRLSFLLLLIIPILSFAQLQTNEKPFVIPELKEWKGGKDFVNISKETTIFYNPKHQELEEVAKAFAQDYKDMFGVELTVKANKPKTGDIYFTLSNNKKAGDEEYEIKIDKTIEVSAKTVTGVYWGTRTILQICEQQEGYKLPKGYIRDYPDYAMRGFMLDCGRKFIPMHFLEDYVKIMSYYKMNTLQVHLNDNGFKQFFENDWSKTYSAFRLESETYPGLAAQDGYYTKDEFRNLQKLGMSKFVEIIPEIDFPAHSLAFAQYMPEIGSKEYGTDHLDLFKPETYTFIDNLLKEYLGGENPVFMGKRMHIGTDEYSNAKKEVVEKFRYLTDRYIKYVEGFGKQACIWGALTHAKGDTPVKSKDVLMFAWYNGYAEPRDMIKQGYKLVSIPDGALYIVPLAGYYYDYLNIKNLYADWTPAKIGKEVFEEKDPNILGGMFAVWNDHVGNGISTRDIHHRVYPAMQTLSVKMWTGKNPKTSFEDFNKKRHTLSEAPNVNLLGRFNKGLTMGVQYELSELKPKTLYDAREAGYGHRISFDIEVKKEKRGTKLLFSKDAVFYLSDPVKGMIGFQRDGYLNTFNRSLKSGEKINIAIETTSTNTKLFIDGKLIEDMGIKTQHFEDPKTKMKYIRTLSFPLRHSGTFNSKVTNFKVEKI